MVVTLDVKDRRILHELELNARQPAVTIGNKIGAASDVVHYRIKRMEEQGVLKFFLCYVNIAKLGLVDYGLYISTKHMQKREEKQFTETLSQHQHVHYFAKIGGSYDYIVGMLSTDPISLYQLVNKINEQFGANIEQLDIVTRIFVEHFPKRYLIDVEHTVTQTVSFGGALQHATVDELDRKIIVALSRNARERISTIAETLGEAQSTISARLRQLEKDKIITGYFAWIEPQSYGYESYNLLVRTKHLNEHMRSKLFHFCNMHPHITWIIKTLGQWDYEIGIEVENQQILQEVINELKEEMHTSIQKMEFVTIFNTIKYTPYPMNT